MLYSYVEKLDRYNISTGDKVYILYNPSASCPRYSYKEGKIVAIIKDMFVPEYPNENTKYYKSKLNNYNRLITKDECDKCKFIVSVNGSKYTRTINRKYIYTEEELNILKEDIYNLNLIYDFKQKQSEELKSFIKNNFKDWNYDNFEDRRKKKVQKRTCPRCGNEYLDFPALSRKDNKTEICPTCGQAEALLQYTGVDLKEDKWKIPQ